MPKQSVNTDETVKRIFTSKNVGIANDDVTGSFRANNKRNDGTILVKMPTHATIGKKRRNHEKNKGTQRNNCY